MKPPTDNRRENPPVRSILRWAGSKRQLLPTLSSHWSPQFKRYIEPFVGSGSLFFQIMPAKAILGDINAELIHALDTTKSHPLAMYRRVHSFEGGKRSYYRLRKKSPSSLDPIERAARFLFLNRFCFNGLYRTNMKGEFNVPFAPSKTGDLPSLTEIRACSRLLANAKLEVLPVVRTTGGLI